MDDAITVSRKELIQARFRAWVNVVDVIERRDTRDMALTFLSYLTISVIMASSWIILVQALSVEGTVSTVVGAVVVFIVTFGSLVFVFMSKSFAGGNFSLDYTSNDEDIIVKRSFVDFIHSFGSDMPDQLRIGWVRDEYDYIRAINVVNGVIFTVDQYGGDMFLWRFSVDEKYVGKLSKNHSTDPAELYRDVQGWIRLTGIDQPEITFT